MKAATESRGVLDALVVGAGPTGLTVAFELARRGRAVKVVDRAPAPAPRSRALIVHCRTQLFLEEAGIRDEFARRAIPVRGMTLRRAERSLATVPFDLGRFPALSLPQTATEEILRSALARLGVEVGWGCEVTAIRQATDVVEATVAGEPVVARHIVACDGAHSAIRKLLEIPFEGEALVETLWMADATLDWDLPNDHVWQLLHRAAPLTAVPMPGDTWRLVTMPARPGEEPDEAFFADAIGARTGRRPARFDVSWLASFRVNCRLAASYGQGRVLLAGDAAHIHSPIGGQGMNVGMLDAFWIGEHLDPALAGHGDELVMSYQSARRPHAEAVIRANARIAKLAEARGPVPRFVRDHVMPRVLALPSVARRAGVEASGLNV